ncbi:MAG: energy transducer TonB [Sphingobacteriaceae bacterium]
MQAKAYTLAADSIQKAEPLYFMNSIAIDAAYMKKIDPSIIASVNVLTGKEASKKYGRNAKDGVVDITLKTEATQFNEQDSLVLLSEIKESKNPSDQGPLFAGKQEGWRAFIGKYLIPSGYTMERGLSGTVIISMVVEKDGTLSNIQLIENPGGGWGEAAVNMLKHSPAWIPGLKNGKPARVLYTTSFGFSSKPVIR